MRKSYTIVTVIAIIVVCSRICRGAANNIFISEVYYDTTSSPESNDEAIELYVAQGGIDPSYWYVTDFDSTNYWEIPDSCPTVNTGEFIVIHIGSGTNDDTGSVYNYYMGHAVAQLSNSGDPVALFEDSDTSHNRSTDTMHDFMRYEGGTDPELPAWPILGWPQSDNGPTATDGKSVYITSYDQDNGSNWTSGTPNLGSDGGYSLAVELTRFIALPSNRAVDLQWLTETEINTAGFNILRSNSRDSEYIHINNSLIPAKGDAFTGASYSYADFLVTNGVTYFYQLEDVEFDGTAELHGPVSGTPGPIGLISPQDGQIVSANISPLFKWNLEQELRSRLVVSLTDDFKRRNRFAFGVRRNQTSLKLPQKVWRGIVGKVKRSQDHFYWRIHAKSPVFGETLSPANKLRIASTTVKLISPRNGAACLSQSDIAFSFMAKGVDKTYVEVSSGRSFLKRETLRAPIRRGANSKRIRGGKLRRLNKLADKGGGLIFWRIRAREIGTKREVLSEVRALRIRTP